MEIESKMETGNVHINITEAILQDEAVFPLSDNSALGVNKNG